MEYQRSPPDVWLVNPIMCLIWMRRWIRHRGLCASIRSRDLRVHVGSTGNQNRLMQELFHARLFLAEPVLYQWRLALVASPNTLEKDVRLHQSLQQESEGTLPGYRPGLTANTG
jgi:hypothetical protein